MLACLKVRIGTKVIVVLVGLVVLFLILAASASYIAVPAAMKLAIPEANSGVYVPMALGLSFPFNITLGIPLYYAAAGWAAPG